MNLNSVDMMNWVLRFAWLLIFFQWLDILMQSFSLRKSLVPSGANLQNRESVGNALQSMPSRTQLEIRARNLLDSYSRGWDAQSMVGLLTHQSARETYRLCATGLFILLLLVACAKQSDQPSLAWLGIAALGTMLFAKGLVLSRIDSMLEEQIISKLHNVPEGAAGISATELASALGPSIENAFKLYIPQPDKFAAALSSAVEGTKKALDSGSSQTSAAVVSTLESARKALDASGSGLTSGLSAGADKLQATFSSHVQQLEKASAVAQEKSNAALSSHSEKLGKVSQDIATGLSTAGDKLQAVFSSHVQQLEKASAAVSDKTITALAVHADKLGKVSHDLAASLDKISELGKDIEKVLHVQQSVEGVMKSVSTSEEFKKTLGALQTHLAASDELVRNASRPRKIRLVEGEA